MNHFTRYAVAVSMSVLILSPSISSAQSVADLQAQIASLLAQVQALQAQLAQQSGSTIPRFCYDFKRDLTVGSEGDDVHSLVNVFAREGIGSERNSNFSSEDYLNVFDEDTAASVVKFQAKYGIRQTGYVGPLTRGRLKQLYGCGTTVYPVYSGIVVSSPKPNETVSSPLKITGYVNGNGWTGFEGQVGRVELLDANGRVLTTSVLLATTEWMKLPTYFTSALSFADPGTETGTLVFSNENVSDRRDYNREFRVPVRFSNNIASNRPPVISGVDGPTALKLGETGMWTVQARDLENGSLSYRVIWGDEYLTPSAPGMAMPYSFRESQTATFTHSYGAAGVYSPTFVVTDNASQQAKTSISVNVGGSISVNRPPKIIGIPDVPPDIRVGQSVSFTWQATDPDNDNLSWSVGWGDGTGESGACTVPVSGGGGGGGVSTTGGGISSSGSGGGTTGGIGTAITQSTEDIPTSVSIFTRSHTWQKPGTYTVTATVSDCRGGTDQSSFSVNVGGVTRTIQIVSLNQKFQMQTGGRAMVQDYKNMEIEFVKVGKEPVYCIQAPCPAGKYAIFIVTLPQENRAESIQVKPGETREIFGANIYLGDLSGDIATLVVSARPIQKPPVTVLYPNGGETFVRGAKRAISWTQSVPKQPVDIYLRSYVVIPPCPPAPVPCAMPTIAPASYPIAIDVFGAVSIGINTYYWDWEVGSTYTKIRVPDGSYTVQICETNTKNCDQSDSYFKITTQQNQPSITIISPNGGETWAVGSTQTIRWTSNAAEQNVFSRISISGTEYRMLFSQTENDGAENWTIPSGMISGNYTISVSLCRADNDCFWNDVSNAPFSIVTAPTTQPLIVSSSEIVGSQTTYTAGQTIKFSVKGIVSNGTVGEPTKGFNVQAWMQTLDPINTVQINGVYQSFNATYNPNTALWDVMMTAPPDASKTYKIDTAFYCSNSSLGCSSGQINKSFNFTLNSQVRPSITVTSPNGGETWAIGSGQNVRWSWNQSNSTNHTVRLVSVATGQVAANLGLGVDTRLGTSGYPFMVPQVTPGNYRVRVCDDYLNGASGACDESDAFSIIGSTTTAYPCSNTNAIGNNQFVGCVWKWQDNSSADPVSADGGTAAGNTPAGPSLSTPVSQTATALSFDWPMDNETPINQYAGKDYYTARWRGNFTFDPGTYRFTGGADDGIRVRVNGVTKIDEWRRGPYHEKSFDMTFDLRQTVQIDVDYFEEIWTGTVKFGWAPVYSYAAPTMAYPQDGQSLDFGGGYMFKANPVSGASGYLFGFFQNGAMIHENYRDLGTMSQNGEYGIWPDNAYYSKLAPGPLQVLVRALINNQWTEARTLNLQLVSPASGGGGSGAGPGATSTSGGGGSSSSTTSSAAVSTAQLQQMANTLELARRWIEQIKNLLSR